MRISAAQVSHYPLSCCSSIMAEARTPTLLVYLVTNRRNSLLNLTTSTLLLHLGCCWGLLLRSTAKPRFIAALRLLLGFSAELYCCGLLLNFIAPLGFTDGGSLLHRGFTAALGLKNEPVLLH
jgi:hypothetical protein